MHARTQVVHADLPLEVLERRYRAPDGTFELQGLIRSLSHQLGPEIAVWRAEIAPDGFDARHSAIWRRYRYDIDCSGRPDPVRAASTWAIEEPLDLAAMRLGAYPLIGEHDFAAFCRQRDGEEGPIMRRVLEVGFRNDEDDVIHFEIAATAFCHQMVRSIVGMLVAIGRGKARAPDVVSMLRSGSRRGRRRSPRRRASSSSPSGIPTTSGERGVDRAQKGRTVCLGGISALALHSGPAALSGIWRLRSHPRRSKELLCAPTHQSPAT